MDTDFYFEEDEDEVAAAAREHFGISYLFPWQRLVIANILEAYEFQKNGFEAEESDSYCRGRQIVLLPTGAGKSLCFQLPALLLDGVTLVIYPLLALMSDQQRRMEEAGLGCIALRGGQSKAERQQLFDRLNDGAKIILANPEVLQNQELLEQLKPRNICHIVIDEAHCVCEWGDTFRPAYLALGDIIAQLRPLVVTAFTATASPQVLDRISALLFGGEAHIIRSESDRPNIRYAVHKASAKQKAAILLARTEQRPLLIFCGTRARAEDMAQELNVCFGRGTARYYHAGLDRSEKEHTEKWFFGSNDGILCATCAYGMGVDKKNIRTVIHLDAPSTAEAYIQEAGRGGRDGAVSKAILLWSLEDSVKAQAFPAGSRQAVMRAFAEAKTCRRQVLLDALGAEQAFCSGCDICDQNESGQKKPETPSDWELAYSLLRKNRHFYSEDTIGKELFERMNGRSRRQLGMSIWSHSDSEELIGQLKLSGKITTGGFFWKDKLRIQKQL